MAHCALVATSSAGVNMPRGAGAKANQIEERSTASRAGKAPVQDPEQHG